LNPLGALFKPPDGFEDQKDPFFKQSLSKFFRAF